MTNIVILLMVIALVITIIFNALRGRNYNNKRHMRRNTVKWILGTYCAVLLISVLVLYLIPEKGFLYPEENFSYQPGEYPFVEEQRVRQDVIKAVGENRLDQIEGISVMEKRNFSFQGDELEISMDKGSDNIPVIVERKEENDGQIEAAFLTTKTIGNEIDLSDQIKLPQMEILGNSLKLTNLDSEIKIAEFKKDFIIAQFLDDNSQGHHNGMSLKDGQKALYLKIPQNVQIKAGQLDVQFVGE